MELYGFMEREKKIPSYFFIITKKRYASCCKWKPDTFSKAASVLLIDRRDNKDE